MRGLWDLARLSPAPAAVTTGCLVAVAGCALLAPLLAARILDGIHSSSVATPELLALAAVLVSGALADAVGRYTAGVLVARATAAIRRRLLRHLFALGLPGLRRHLTGDLISRLVGNCAQAAGAIPALGAIAVSGLTSVGGLLALWLVDWRAGLTFVLGAGVALALLRSAVGRVSVPFAAYQEVLGGIAARLTDALAGSRTIQAAGTAEREIDRVLAGRPELGRASRHCWRVQRDLCWQADLVLAGLQLAVLAVAGLGVAAGRNSAGDLLAVSLYLTYATAALDRIDSIVAMRYAHVDLARVHEVLVEPARRPSGRATLPGGAGAVRARDLVLDRGGELVLGGVDLTIPAGGSVALVGRSGQGKSTLALLVGGLLDPDRGSVLIDGRPVCELDPADRRRAVGYAFDRPVLHGDTVREAVTYGHPAATAAELAAALRMTGCQDFVARLPGGLDTPLPAAHFSGGELQRLGLARALVAPARVLILDDATSSLDTVTEAQVTEAVTAGLAGHSRLIVTHRAATAAKADLVAWLDRGRVRAVAPHRTLWASSAQYRAVFAADRADEPVP